MSPHLLLTSLSLSVLKVSKAACILTTQPLMRILRSREAAASVNVKTWPTIIDTGTDLKYLVVTYSKLTARREVK